MDSVLFVILPGGGVYSDTLTSISYIRSDTLTNRHPICYTILIGLFMYIGELCGKDLTWSVGLFTITQMFILGCEFLYCISWMVKHRVNKSVRIATALFWIFFPLIPLYSISVWKDTPFCMAVLFWTPFIIDLYLEMLDISFRAKTIVGFLIGGILTAFTRNNGIYVVIFVVFVELILILKRMWIDKGNRCLGMCSAGMLFAILFIQGPVYDMLGISQTEGVENFGIPLQQIGAVVAYDGHITEEQKENINRFIPYENIKGHYSPMLADDLKWYAGLNGQYLEEHEDEFLRLWWELLWQNPSIYIKSYMMATAGFWNVDVSTGDAYVQTFIWNESSGIVQKDYFSELFGFSFRHFTDPRRYISCAWFFWFFFVSAWFCMKHYGWKSIFPFTPQLGIWITIMIATPIAASLRYIAALMFTLPFVIIIPMLLERTKVNGG